MVAELEDAGVVCVSWTGAALFDRYLKGISLNRKGWVKRTSARARSMCWPHPAQVGFPHELLSDETLSRCQGKGSTCTLLEWTLACV